MDFERFATFQLIICLSLRNGIDGEILEIRLDELQAALGIVSPVQRRRLLDLAEELDDLGYIKRLRPLHDRRQLTLLPTADMLNLDRAWMVAYHAPLAEMFGPTRYSAALNSSSAYQAAFRCVSLETVGVASDVVNDNPLTDFFFRRFAGFRVLLTLIDALKGADYRQIRPGFASHAAMLCGVSRSHMGNIMRDAAAQGLVLKSDGRGTPSFVSDQFLTLSKRFIAESLAAVDMVNSKVIERFPASV